MTRREVQIVSLFCFFAAVSFITFSIMLPQYRTRFSGGDLGQFIAAGNLLGSDDLYDFEPRTLLEH